jgi:hypothetical protein
VSCQKRVFDNLELEYLWSSKTLVYDVSRKYNFLTKATLMWTINDFSSYEMVSGWSTHEKLAYPYYMENNKTFTLINDDKTSFFFTATSSSCQQITGTEITRKNKKDFFIGRVERNVAVPLF